LAQVSQQSHAVVVLPSGMYAGLCRQGHSKWLSHGRVLASDETGDMLARVLGAIGHAVPDAGLAALRFWGQTGERATAWIAAADPVHLEAQLDHLRLHALPGEKHADGEMRDLFVYLQATLGDDGRHGFVWQGRCGYLRGGEPLATAAVSSRVVDGCAPDDFMPGADVNATHDQLLCEIQMALHDHEINLRREASGTRPVNSLWLWGGGTAPEPQARPIPALFADDPLLRGYWHSCDGAVASFGGDFARCLRDAPRGFVAVMPEEGEYSQDAALERSLAELRAMQQQGRLHKLTLLFSDGPGMAFRRGNRWQFWRRVPPLVKETKHDG